MRIGVFDSGIGGKAVEQELQVAFPHAEILRVDDRSNLPYGTKSASELIILTDNAIQPLLQFEPDIIVIACNTATAAAIDTLRENYPTQKFIGLEPMVKPAPGLTKTGTIAICATPATLSSKRYRNAKNLFANDVHVYEPDCSDWAYLIENNMMNQKRIDTIAEDIQKQNADVVVLGCTHYHWIKDELVAALSDSAIVLEPTDAIVKRVKQLLHL